MIVQNKSLEIQLFVHYSYTKCCRYINALPSLPWINSGIKPELPRVLYWWSWLRWESLLLLLLWVSLDGSSSPSSSSIAGWWCRMMIIVLIAPLDHILASRWPSPIPGLSSAMHPLLARGGGRQFVQHWGLVVLDLRHFDRHLLLELLAVEVSGLYKRKGKRKIKTHPPPPMFWVRLTLYLG